MHKIMQLKDELLEELESYAGEKLTAESVMHIKCLASAADHLCNICDGFEDYEDSSRRMSRRRYGVSRRSYDDGMTAQYRVDTGRYEVEPGRASSRGDKRTIKELERLAEDSDETTRRAIHKALQMLQG